MCRALKSVLKSVKMAGSQTGQGERSLIVALILFLIRVPRRLLLISLSPVNASLWMVRGRFLAAIFTPIY